MKRLLLGLLLFCVGCGGNSELYPAAGGAAISRSIPKSDPMAPPYHAQDPGNIEGVQETHSVANRSDCDKLEQKFLRQGRQLRLVDRIRSKDRNNPLQWTCVFQGKDATPGYFDDNRSK